MFSLAGKKALVTGATGGIGGAIVKALHGAGAQVAISGSRQEKLTSLRDVILSEGRKAEVEGSNAAEKDPSAPLRSAQDDNSIIPLVCDLSKLDTVENLVKEAEEKLGGLDILVCNAGVTKDNIAMRMKDEEWQQVLDINLTASFRMSRAAMRGMMKRRHGRMIYITSVVGTMGNAGQANYCASKAGLTGMSKSFAHELASRGITSNCIAPGFIATNMTEVLTDDQKNKINTQIPQGRMGTPDDIAAGVVYLASDEAAYVTGQTLHINGGMVMV